ncbi:MAG TPA: bifunctional ADP-dependent NAD(P)H-hydrate dehydratase/NAD(P)H-hydrate epimerase [Syntrophomonas sp.]|jgi:NAD(P)H-hydrate epimerase|nr:bifunctional ADP-dependent NAD(P)H-hydrate dehydratase/NAD(P)H-hydrate epimerase [Syntrophomonas sp.]HCF71036.1 bifunctional ADP-dependent NAD(P)H-hydrate dehydratase/NAD(P)H-hydrate epimerase [Syntrophomonas sp.]
MKLLKAEEMKRIDKKASTDYEIPSLILMENAGLRTVEVIDEMLAPTAGKTVVIIAGKGNNGGDGLVVARHLINAGATVDVFMLGEADRMTPDAGTNYRILAKMTDRIYPLFTEEHLDRLMLSLLVCDIIVDAMYGIGFKGVLGDFDARVVKMMNWCKAPVVAVDIPSGVEADTGKVHGEAVKARQTVTFALPKIGMVVEPGKDYAGTLTVADISIPRSLLESPELTTNLITEAMIKPYLYTRAPETHKGTYGHALIIGGSLGMTGAVRMSSFAALRIGAGLVTAAVPLSALPIAAADMEVMTTPLAETENSAIALEALPVIENLLTAASVCTIGPGMSRYPEAGAVLRFVLEKAGSPVVIDADGLNALGGEAHILKNRQVPIVLTPHPGEMARLINRTIEEIQADRMQIARQFAVEYGVCLVLKGNKTIVATPSGEVFVNITGNPGMATAGSGDVLSGMIAGLIAQGLKTRDAAITAVYLHGLAGDYAAGEKGQRGIVAGDILNTIPYILKQLENN